MLRSFVALATVLNSCAAFAPFAGRVIISGGGATHPRSRAGIERETPLSLPVVKLKLASNGGDSSKSNKKMSAAARARRDEERRRRERADDVVIGKTSALPDAADFTIDPRQTEAQWRMQATDVEREVDMQTDRGMQCLKMLQLEEADEAFERVYDLKPDAYLWQAGVVKFYLDDLSGAADCFASNAATFEQKFFSPASEERIWRDACELKIKSQMSRKERKKVLELSENNVPSAPPVNLMDDGVSRETRKVIRIARDLFQASVENDHSAVALSRAKLRSICGEFGAPPTLDRKMWKLSSWYYLGLHYDALGDFEESKECMKMALRQCASSGNGDDIVQILPMIHMTRRDWFDDDAFSPDTLSPVSAATTTAPNIPETEPPVYKWSSSPGGQKKKDQSSGARSVVKVSIMESLDKMRLQDLKQSLKKRSLKTTGSKAELQQRLLDSLLSDAGF